MFNDNLFNAGSPPPPFVPPPDGSLGRFQFGQAVPLTVTAVDPTGFPVPPDAAPTATITDAGGDVLAVVTLAMTREDAVFSLAFLPDFGTPLGTYNVTYSFAVDGTPGTATGSFELIAGGDSGGRVISMFAIDRPEATYVVAQLASGRLVQGRNPRL